jgi:hypothetical protein
MLPTWFQNFWRDRLPCRSRSPRASVGKYPRGRYHRPYAEALEERCVPTTRLVSNTADAGPGSFRQAILDVNASPGNDEIAFDIRPGGLQTITLLSPLPPLMNPRGVIIDGTTQPGDGTTQPGSHCNTRTIGDDAVLNIEFDGHLAGPNTVGLDVQSPYIYVRGLRGLVINPVYAANSLWPLIGFDWGSDLNNPIDGTQDGACNLLSGNCRDGVRIDNVNGNVVQGNDVGTDASGASSLPNRGNGVTIELGAGQNTVGGALGPTSEGPCTGACNVISANGQNGVAIADAETANDLVFGNDTGTDVNGTAPLGTVSAAIEEPGTRLPASATGLTDRDGIPQRDASPQAEAVGPTSESWAVLDAVLAEGQPAVSRHGPSGPSPRPSAKSPRPPAWTGAAVVSSLADWDSSGGPVTEAGGHAW